MTRTATAVTVVEPTTSNLPATTPSHLLALAVQQNADLDKLQKLMDLQERWEANEARKAFVAAMAGFKAEPLEIFKNKRVEFTTRDGDTTSYKHAELSDITDVVGPALAKHHLSFRWDIKQGDKGVTVDCILTHIAGHSERVTMSAPPDASGKKNAIQQIASSTTYLQRYTLLAITGMSTKGQDDDGRAFEEEPVVDKKDSDWIRVANQLEHPDEYQTQRAKMLADYGGVNNLPLSVRNAFNAAKARVTPKDEE